MAVHVVSLYHFRFTHGKIGSLDMFTFVIFLALTESLRKSHNCACVDGKLSNEYRIFFLPVGILSICHSISGLQTHTD